MNELRDWIGRTETREERLAKGPAARMAATLGGAAPDGNLPPLWHWLYFLDATPRDELAEDGHARRGVFLPPVDLPRRMWAGGRVAFHAPLPLGGTARRVSTLMRAEEKACRSGPLVFVTLRHEVSLADGTLAVAEEQDIVYREAAGPGIAPPPPPAPVGAPWHRAFTADTVLLFRYSALTFNGHRIHYDRDYAAGHEGYPGLVVHGPLTATLLADLAAERGAGRLAQFDYRAVSPLFDGETFTLNGRPTGAGAELWAANAKGGVAMRATAAFADD